MSQETKTNPAERKATLGPSLAMLLVVMGILVFCIIVLKLDVQTPLAIATGALWIYAIYYLKLKWKDCMKAYVDSIASAIDVMIIIMLIGCTVGTWVASGTVPYVIYLGLKIFSPRFFLVSILVICCIMSVVTGSSWTTAGTVGIAFMGVGAGLGIPAPITAGCIVCGAYFGDKQSPMSDTTNYAAAVAGTDLYRHVRSMLYTTGPAILVTAVIELFLGFKYGGAADTAAIQEIISGLQGAYHLSPILLLPLVVMIVLIVLKAPAVPTMLICSLTGALFTVLVQGRSLSQALTYFYSGYVGETGNEMLDKLLTRGGMSSMYYTVGIMFWSLSMAGMLMRCGIVDCLMEKVEGIISTRFGLITTQLISGYILSFVAADPYLTMLLPARAFADEYDKQGIDRCVLSRTCEDGATIVCPAVPWGTNGVYIAATLGVATLSYIPFYCLLYINPIFVLLNAATGFGIIKAKKDENADAAAA